MDELLVPVRERKTRRHALTLDCQVVRERDFKLLGRQAVDLSADGMLVLTDERVLTGEDVIVSFRVPTLRAWFDAEATVARVVHGRRPGDRGRAIGLQFSRLGRVSSSYVKAGLFRYPPTLPARTPRLDYAESVARIMMGS